MRHNPFYYILCGVGYLLPWLPLAVLWFILIFRDLRRQHSLSCEQVLLLVWSLGSILLLSLSVTKRDMYLLPILPAFAIMSAVALPDTPPRWIRLFFSCWVGLCTALLVTLTFSPMIVRIIPVFRHPKPGLATIFAFLGTFTIQHAVAAACLTICLWMLFRRRLPSAPVLWIGVTAVLYVGAFAVAGKAVDLDKSMKNDTLEFVAKVPSDRRPKIAGRDFDETMRAIFYYYSDWSVPLVNDSRRIRHILEGGDAEYDSIINGKPSIPELPDIPCHVLAQGSTGDTSHRRPFYWIEGIGKPSLREK